MIPIHIPILKEKIGEYFSQISSDKKVILDGTAGEGGHSEYFLETFPESRVILVDRDETMLERAIQRLEPYSSRIHPVLKNFSELNEADLKIEGSDGPDGILLDFGISTYHLKSSGRGFSFQSEEELDMRLDSSSLSAFTILNKYKAEQLLDIFRKYGEEKWSTKIVPKIIEERRKNPIRTTMELAKLIERVIPRKFWPAKVHPSFRIFQALRIESNGELKHIEKAIPNLWNHLSPGGVFACLSFHSLEDRIVKNHFRDLAREDLGILMTKKPISPEESEIDFNPASRSAKLRAIQKKSR